VNRTAPSAIVLGATGYTGRLVAAALRREGQPFIVAARDPHRLAALAAEVGELASTHVVNIRDADALSALLKPGDTVINCVGPFIEMGEPVVRACIHAGAHYLDTSGEQAFIRSVHDRHDEAARDAGISVVPGMAFEYALGDCATAVGGRGMARPIRTADIIYAWRDAASSRGTRRTVVRVLGRRGVTREQGQLHARPHGAQRRTVTLASGAPMEAVSFHSGEVVTVPRHLHVETVRGWAVIGSGAARIAPVVAPLLPLAITLLRPLVEAMAARRPDPTPDERHNSLFTIRVELHDRIGLRRAVELRGRDPYGLTAAILVHGARAAADGETPRGVLAPAQLVEPRRLLTGLAPLGLRLVENA
jgi:short subunit dehydrogenase-like uncharacterized protein